MNALVSLKQAPDVTLQGLTKRYANHGPAVLDGLDLDLSAGQFNVILGPSGCGKSTLLRLIAGLEQPDSGRVLIGGQPGDTLGLELATADAVLFNAASGRRLPLSLVNSERPCL